MTTPQQFGEYLLFRKLTSDAMGETYRAGKIGSQGIERVVLLRLFNGAGIDSEVLWRTIADRMSLHRILQNPHIGDGADVGRVGSTPYVAYEYVSGKNLAELLRQARSRGFQIPTEHALFIMERLTFGLTAAYSTRHREERIQHGFLVPEDVLLSNEGEVRLIGFESGPGLREFLTAAPLREAFGPYLAPEVGPGTVRKGSDDVFSLGSMLYELLTGSRLTHSPDGNFDPQIDEAVLAAEEQPLPPALRALLKSSLVAGPQRINDVQQWQQAFSRYIAEADYNPTTFNLAFFMHTLFGGEIEQESVDIAREKATQVDVAALAKTPVHEPTPGPSDTVLIPPGPPAEPDSVASAAAAGQYGGSAQKKTNWKMLAPLALVAIGAGVAVTYYMMGRNAPGSEDSTLADLPVAAATDLADDTLLGLEPFDTSAGPVDEAAAIDSVATSAAPVAGSATEPRPTDAVDIGSVAAPPTPDEVEGQIRQLVDARAKEVEGTLQKQYEDQLEELRQQLEEARLAQEQLAAAAPTEPAASTDAASTSPAAGRTGTNAASATQTTGAAGGGPAPAQADATQTPSRQSAGQATPAKTEPASEPEPAKPAPPKPVAVGDLVTPGAGVVPPVITQRPNPRYPPSARRLGKQATVALKILIDEDGRVTDVQTDGDKAGFGFDEAAIDAARRTRWKPATKNGIRVKMWIDLKIAFRP